MSKKKILNILFGAALSLLLINILIDSLIKSNSGNDENGITSSEIEKTFLNTIDEYGVESNWIEFKKNKSKTDDSIRHVINIKLPAEIPIPLLIKELKNIYDGNSSLKILCEEKKIFGTTNIKIYSNNILKLSAVLSPDNNAVRNRSELFFLLEDFPFANEGSFDKYVKLSIPFTAVYYPSADVAMSIEELSKFGRKCAIILNDEITESKYRIQSDYSKNRLRSSVIAIITDFQEASLFLVDTKSGLFNSPVFNFIRDEFLARKIKIIKTSELISLDASSDAEIISLFDYYCENSSDKKEYSFFIDLSKFNLLQNEIERFRKKGNKVVLNFQEVKESQ